MLQLPLQEDESRVDAAACCCLPICTNSGMIADQSTHTQTFSVKGLRRQLITALQHLIVAVASPGFHVLQQWIAACGNRLVGCLPQQTYHLGGGTWSSGG